MRIGITCYPTYGGSGVVATELGMELAARGHEIHFISYAPPIRMNPNDPRIRFHEVEVVSYPLFDHPPYTLALATKMLEVFESASLDLLHVHYAIPHSVSAMLARSMAAPRRLPFVTTLHGTDITLVGSNRSHLPLLAQSNHKRVRYQAPHRSHSQFRELRTLQSLRRQGSCGPMGSQWRTHPHAPVEFPPRQTPPGCHRSSSHCPCQDASQAGPYRRRSGPWSGGTPGTQVLPSERRFLPWQTGQRLRKARRCRSFSASLSA